MNCSHSTWAHSRTPKANIPSVDEIVKQAIDRTQCAIRDSKFIPWKFHPRNGTFEPPEGEGQAINKVIVKENDAGNSSRATRDYLTEDESYTLTISEDGEAEITGATAIGTVRGLQTFQQLFYKHTSGHGSYTPYAPVSITDSPKWAHRGLNLDVSRNPYKPKDVERTLDAMASAKMSRLHLHITDSQAWPLEVPAFPELAKKGAYHPSQIWSTQDVEDVQIYGLLRGVSVFLEVDLPGHTGSIAYSMPELVTAWNRGEDWPTYASEPPSGQLKLNSTAVDDFLEKMLQDVLPRVSPLSPFFHTGGDELNQNSYLLDETVRSNSSEVLGPLVQRVNDLVHNQLKEHNLTPIVWEEMLTDWNLTFPAGRDEVIIQVWQDSETVLKVLEKGYRVLFGDYHHWYLACGHGSFINPDPSGSTEITSPFVDYCSPMKNWRYMLTYNPHEGIPEDLQDGIQGGETHMWSEQADPSSVDTLVWPRTAAAAEVLWSGPREVSQIVEAQFRLGEWRERAVGDLNVHANVVSMSFCLMHEGSCEE